MSVLFVTAASGGGVIRMEENYKQHLGIKGNSLFIIVDQLYKVNRVWIRALAAYGGRLGTEIILFLCHMKIDRFMVRNGLVKATSFLK